MTENQTTAPDKLRVARRGGMTAEDLARHLNVSVEQIERSLLRLISKGLVEGVDQRGK
jgi:predicted transcriptional regulator